MTFTGKNVLVTGGSRSIGAEICKVLAGYGLKVWINYRSKPEIADALKQEIESNGGKAAVIQFDATDEEGFLNAIKAIVESDGELSYLVNNAGIVRDGFLLSMKEEAFDDVINTNLKGAFHMIRHLYSHMMRKRSGRIINISSIVGLTGNAAQANYAAAKAGMIGLTKSTAKELAGRGVTCNAIAPGYIQSDMTDAMPEKAKEAIASQIPMKRTGLPQDVANLAVFLAGPGASYITGEVIRVDGGLAM